MKKKLHPAERAARFLTRFLQAEPAAFPITHNLILENGRRPEASSA